MMQNSKKCGTGQKQSITVKKSAILQKKIGFFAENVSVQKQTARQRKKTDQNYSTLFNVKEKGKQDKDHEVLSPTISSTIAAAAA